MPNEKKHIPKRVIKDLYDKFNWLTSSEKKWAGMSPMERIEFANLALKMCNAHPDIHMHAIVVKKERVEEHIRKDANKLYNYMIKLCIIDCMATQDAVTMVPDPRSIKVESGNSLHDYLQTELWFVKQVKTVLSTVPCDSKSSRGIQFADMLAGLVQTRFEDKHFDHLKLCVRHLRLKKLFF